MLSSGCDVCACRVLLLEEVWIGEHATCPSLGSPDGVALTASSAFSSTFWVSSFVSEVLGFSTSNTRAVTVTASQTSYPFSHFSLRFLLPPCTFCGLPILLWGRVKVWDGYAGSVSTPFSKMSANKDAASSSVVGQSGKDVSGEVHVEKSMDKLNMREFCERFCIPNGVSVHLVDEEAVSTEKFADKRYLLHQGAIQCWAPVPPSIIVKEFLHITQIPPAYIHPNMVRVLMGCSILSMLFNLDLSLLEVLFIYSIKKEKNDIYSFVASFPSLQLVTSLPDSTKGAVKGHVLVKGLWAGLSVHPDMQFAPNHSLKAPKGEVGRVGGKASFDRLNRLFEIAADERSCETLLSAQNLRLVTQEPQPYVLNILPRRLPKKVVAGKHFISKISHSTRRAKGRCPGTQALLNEREEKRQEGTLRKAPGDKRSAPSPPADGPRGKEEEGFPQREKR
ncbi:hypothetical protein CK203_061704 [Vitis vinifera]|uniref:Uncharacterized protein n=1 Tax=Vitis vinifera TaxID=29760 RepID=A0A438G8A0_VITVI|nr:hypothetical protein CK203_061704 [Vitis vinifera]